MIGFQNLYTKIIIVPIVLGILTLKKGKYKTIYNHFDSSS